MEKEGGLCLFSHKMRKRKKKKGVAALCLSALLLAGCTAPQTEESTQTAALPPAAPPAADAGSLTIYSALPEEELSVYLHAFTKDTGIDVSCERLSAGEMMRRAEQERDAPRVSVLLGGPSDYYENAAKTGLIEPYQSEELQNVPEAYRDADGYWNPIYIGVISFACDEEWFGQRRLAYPDSWDDLLAPALEGQVVMASPQSSGTSYTVLASLMQKLGEQDAWAYFEALDRNIAFYTASGLGPAEAVKDGEAAVGIVFSHDGRRLSLDGYPVELRYPADGTPAEIGACALVCGGPAGERENAERFIDWFLSRRGQECFIEAKSCRLPVNATARTVDGLPELSSLNLIESDSSWAGMVQQTLSRQFCDRIERAQSPQRD